MVDDITWGNDYFWGRLTEARWGAPNCPGGEIAEQYIYKQSGPPIYKRLEIYKDGKFGRLNSIYGYDNEGRMNWEWYPNDKGQGFDSPNLLYDYDDMKRLTGIRRQIRSAPLPQPPNYTTTTLASGATHGPAGNPLTMNYLGYTQTRSYNTLQQLTRIQASGSGLLSFDEEYRFSGSQNNGRMTQLKDWVSGEEVNYGYDSLNRLISSYTTGTEWGVNFIYDGFGNKTDHTGVLGKLAYPALSITVNPANNRVNLAGTTYDSNGNLTAMPSGATFAYDVENRVAGAGASGYSYGADNRRVWDGAMYTFWSVAGQRIGRYSVSGTEVDMNPLSDTYMQQIHQFATAETKLYFGGMLAGEGAGVNGTNYTAMVVDRLGSVRVRGAERYAYYPYGEERVATAQGRDKFATYLRDANGVDYADQRYFQSQWGRFLTADPSGSGFNLYAYVDGDPINFNDPEGLVRCGEIPTQTGFLSNDILQGNDYGLFLRLIWHEGGYLNFYSRHNSPQLPAGNQIAMTWAHMTIAQAIVNRLDIVNGRMAVLGTDGYWYSGRGNPSQNTRSASVLGWGSYGATLRDIMYGAAAGTPVLRSGDIDNRQALVNTLNRQEGDILTPGANKVMVWRGDDPSYYVSRECFGVISAVAAGNGVYFGRINMNALVGVAVTSWNLGRRVPGGREPFNLDPTRASFIGTVGPTFFYGFGRYRYGTFR